MQKGFTLIEVLVVLSVLITLIGLTTISLLNANRQTSLSTSIDSFVTDLKQQQLKAMVGDTEGRTQADSYGVYFGTDSYTLFHGAYSSSDPTNFTVALGGNIQFSAVLFPSSQIIFLKGSGEVSNYASSSSTLVIRDIVNNRQKTITVNRYGVVTDIN